MILIYVRHAIAMEREEFARHCLAKGIEPDDERRPLTEDGIKKMKRGAAGLSLTLKTFDDLKAKPTVLSSPLLRATETAEIICRQLKHVKRDQFTKTASLSPGATPKAFRDWLYDYTHSHHKNRPHSQTAFIVVGHEPGLSEAVSWWVSGEQKKRFPFKKGGATCIEIGGALMPGEGRILWALPPWALRSLAAVHASASKRARKKNNKKSGKKSTRKHTKKKR